MLINSVFPNILQYATNLDTMIDRVILTLRNNYVDDINNLLIHRFTGDIIRYYSFDEPLDAIEYTVHEDFLNSLKPTRFPITPRNVP